MPAQLNILALVLLLFYWPWLLFSGDTPESWLASVVSVQLAFVMACNKLTQESWATAIIIVEAICMIANILLVILSSKTFFFHAEFVLAAFIIELLIITISLRSEGVSDDSRRHQSDLFNIINPRGNLHAKNRGGAY